MPERKTAASRAKSAKRAARVTYPNVEAERVNLRTLLASNPNYFGTIAKSKLKVVKKIAGNTKYEELTCVAWNAAYDRLEATIAVKLTAGYSGGLCTNGSEEYVRFYVDWGSGWQDEGIAATPVHDIPAGKDCANQSRHPLVFNLSVPFDPRKRGCRTPQLPRVRAILSWEIQPPANQPGWTPVWGNVKECAIQIDKSRTLIGVLDSLTAVAAGKIDPDILEQIEEIKKWPEPLPVPPLPDPPPLAVQTLAKKYGFAGKATKAKAKGESAIEPHRFGFEHAMMLKAQPVSSDAEFQTLAKPWLELGIDIAGVLQQIEDTTGDVSYEQLECVGLDNNTDSLVATYRIKRPGGYSGDLCSAGSTEYIAFWADFDDDCDWTYLGTVRTKAYDFGSDLPGGGLCYAAVLPVDLSKVRKPCSSPVIGRVRAVLSWNAAPSTTDPDAVPYWGNRLDAHVLVRPGTPHPGTVTPNLTVVGGIYVDDIDNVSGLTLPTAKFVDTGFDADYLHRACPFGGRIVVRGLQFPGYRYRVQVRQLPAGVWTTLVKPIWVQPVFGSGFWHSPAADGYFNYLGYMNNFAGILAYFDSSDDTKYEIRLNIDGVPGSASQVVQLDNTPPDASIEITSGTGSCGMFTPGVTISGRFVARDTYFRNYSLTVKGHPSANSPTPSSGNVQTPVAGSGWTLDTTGMAECGYIIEVVARDRAILNSQSSHHQRPASVGFCLRK